MIFDSWFKDREKIPAFADHYEHLGNIRLKQNVVCGDSVMTLYARSDRSEEMQAKLKGQSK